MEFLAILIPLNEGIVANKCSANSFKMVGKATVNIKHVCYFIVLMSSVLFYNAETTKNEEKTHEWVGVSLDFRLVHYMDKNQAKDIPVTESLTGSLRTELKSRLETLVWYWHWYDPSLSKVTWRMLKVAELVLDDWVVLNESEVFFRMNVPPKCWVEIEQMMLVFWPQVTSPAGFMEMLGFGRITEKNTIMLEW